MRLMVSEFVPALLLRLFHSLHTPHVQSPASRTATHPRHLVIVPLHENLHVLAVADVEVRSLLLPQQGVALDAEPPAIHCYASFLKTGLRVARRQGNRHAFLESIVLNRETPSKRVK